MNSQPCNPRTEPLSPILQEITHGQSTNDTSARPVAVHNSAMWEVTHERLQRIERILDSLPRQPTNSLRLHVPDSEALPPPAFPSQTDYSEPPSQYFARNPTGQSLNLSSHLDSLRCFSSRSPQDYMAHETRLQQRICYQEKVRLGYDKAIAVLLLELERGPEYEPVHRSVSVDQPDTVFGLRSLSTDFDTATFEDIARVLVNIIGSQRACHILENANIGEIPPLHCPTPKTSAEMWKSSARSRSSERGAENPSFMVEPSSSKSTSNHTSKTSSGNSTTPLLSSSSVREADGYVTKPRPPRPPKALEPVGREPIDNDAETHHHTSSSEIGGDLYPRAPRPLLSHTQMEVDARYVISIECAHPFLGCVQEITQVEEGG